MFSIIIINKHQKFLFTFVPDNQVGQLISIASQSLTMLKQLMQSFHLLKCGLQIKMIDHLATEATGDLIGIR